jgi:photosystem II stability/assembly factor-like uncharacterized protein
LVLKINHLSYIYTVMKIKLIILFCILLGIPVVMAGSWQFIGLDGYQVISLETDPADSQYIYAGTTTGLYLTDDGGQFWSPTIPFNVRIEYLAKYPLSADTVLKLIGGGSNSDGLYYTTNRGLTWDVIGFYLNPRRIGFDPVDTGFIYICFPDGIITSGDCGQTYSPANSGLLSLNITDVLGDGRNNLEAYAVGPNFVAHTTNFGNNWDPVVGLFGVEGYGPSRIAHDAINPETLYVTCYRYIAISEDGGVNWRYTQLPGTGYQPIACDPDAAGKIIVGSADGFGVYESTNAGATFNNITGLLGDIQVFSLKYLPNGKLLAGTSNGIYKYDFNVGIEETPEALPSECSLPQNYPNPFNGQTTIEFFTPAREQVSLAIYDIGGRLVRNLYRGLSYGHNSVLWNCTNDGGIEVAGGIYVCRLQSSSGIRTCLLSYLK